MTAFNIVRTRVKPGRESDFVEAHRNAKSDFPGMRRVSLVKTGDRTFCLIGEWEDMSAIAAARPGMIAILDTLRDMLEDLGGDLGITDPASGEAVFDRQA